MELLVVKAVIASEAKRSRAAGRPLDRFVASLLAMTGRRECDAIGRKSYDPTCARMREAT
jgi:hypothetical protein